MHVLCAGLATFDVVHLLDHVPGVTVKTTSRENFTGAGGPATNAAVALAALWRAAGRRAVTSLLTTLGTGPTAAAMKAELAGLGVDVLDATDPSAAVPPAISSIIEHPGGRFVASTNARVPVDAGLGGRLLEGAVASGGVPEAVLVDGHNPELAALALEIGEGRGARPVRILDGGSWKGWFEPLLGRIDVAVVSADFRPPGCETGGDVAEALDGYGISRVVRTDGPNPVMWWWDGASGRTPVPAVDAVSTMGAGDIFHGAFAWTIARRPAADPVELIALASRVAGLSTRTFGTRSWIDDPALPDLL